MENFILLFVAVKSLPHNWVRAKKLIRRLTARTPPLIIVPLYEEGIFIQSFIHLLKAILEREGMATLAWLIKI
ncbi:hypothetical protein CV717_00880 [Bacillus cereus]|nr:hypothetical protein CV741_16660 [Bacillus cereus]PWN79008.1 hypothetical protein CV717_00880 [Bacillus cereus]